MSISFVAAGTVAQHTDTVTPAYPAGVTAGRLAVLQVVSGHPSDATPSTPSGWSLAGTMSGGGGTFGSGTGPRRMTWFVRVLAGADPVPTTAIPSGAAGSLIGACIAVLSRSAGTGWRWAFTSGEDTTSGTGLSVTMSDALTWRVDDLAQIGFALPVGTAAQSSPTTTGTGLTFATASRVDSQITTGNGARLQMTGARVTAGSGTVTATASGTLSTASTAVAGMLRLREASSTIAATPQTASPPRNLVAATGMLADDIVSATLYRQYGNARTPVRAASDVDVTGQNALLRVDAEQPFGVPISYAAELTDINGLVWTVTSGTITSTVTSDVVSDAVQGTGAAVTIVSWPNKKRDRDATTFNVGGRIVVVGKPRSSASATVTVRTDTQADGDDMQAVLDAATEGVIQIRARTTLPGVDNHLAIVSDDEDRDWYSPRRRWAMDVYETEPWPDVLEAAGFTLADVAANFSTLGDIAAFFTPGSLLSIALYDFGV